MASCEISPELQIRNCDSQHPSSCIILVTWVSSDGGILVAFSRWTWFSSCSGVSLTLLHKPRHLITSFRRQWRPPTLSMQILGDLFFSWRLKFFTLDTWLSSPRYVQYLYKLSVSWYNILHSWTWIMRLLFYQSNLSLKPMFHHTCTVTSKLYNK